MKSQVRLATITTIFFLVTSVWFQQETHADNYFSFVLLDDLYNTVGPNVGKIEVPSDIGDFGVDDSSDGIGNNGHGNNEDGVDSSNPGNAPFEDSSDGVDDESSGGGAQGNGNGKGKG